MQHLKDLGFASGKVKVVIVQVIEIFPLHLLLIFTGVYRYTISKFISVLRSV